MYDVIIIGSGPAGLTAAIYTSRANLKTLILAGRIWGGQLMLTSLVENFPGFPEGILGPELMMKMRKQAENHGAEIIDVNFKSADFSKKPFEITTDDEKTFLTKSVIIATGTQTKWLGVPGEKEKIGRGISSCAPCDAAFYRNKNVIVAGGGDSALEEAIFLTKFATNVYIVHRRDTLRASKIMQKKAVQNPKIKFIFNTEIIEVLGKDKVTGVGLKSKITRSTSSGQRSKIQIKDQKEEKQLSPEALGGKSLTDKDQELTWEMPIDGVFVAIGHIPNSQVFRSMPADKQDIETDEHGFIKISGHTRTNIEGVFVAGDVHDSHYQQAITAAGFGCMAALDTERWLMEGSIDRES